MKTDVLTIQNALFDKEIDGTWQTFLTDADWSVSPSSMLFRLSYCSTQWVSAFASLAKYY